MSYLPDYKPLPGSGKPLDTAIVESLDLKHVVYARRPAGGTTPAMLESILAAARRHNRRSGVTGLLLFLEGRYIQCLEGPGRAVSETLARIATDPRHHDVSLLIDAPVARRSFAGWDMACAEIGESSWLQLATAQWQFNQRHAAGDSPGFGLMEKLWAQHRRRLASGHAPVT